MSETILIVDDEKEIADLVELYLKNENYHIEKAGDSETAKAAACANLLLLPITKLSKVYFGFKKLLL